MDYESDQYECDIWQGRVIITCKESKRCGIVSLLNSNGRNITLSQFKSCIKSHGVERTLSTFAKLVSDWQ
jgi:hypothetical protein